MTCNRYNRDSVWENSPVAGYFTVLLGLFMNYQNKPHVEGRLGLSGPLIIMTRDTK